MNDDPASSFRSDEPYEEPLEPVAYDFGLNRRSFVQFLGAGLLVAVNATPALAQRSRGGGGSTGARTVASRVHLAKDGTITVMTGKVEGGQGARAELTQAAAEELRIRPNQLTLVMADTELVPDDGITAGSRSTPSSVPAVRQGAAAARQLLIDFAAKQWNIEPGAVTVNEGKATHQPSGRTLSYAEFAADESSVQALQERLPEEIQLTAVGEWKVMGRPAERPNALEIVTGRHQYPSDITRPGMLYGKVLRAPSYGAKLVSVDTAVVKSMSCVQVVQDDQFVGIAAPDSYVAEKALDALAKTAKWERAPHPSSKELFSYLQQHTRESVPANPFQEEISQAKQVLRQSYQVAYAQHAPLEPRAAVAEWENGKLTVWTGTQNPFGCRNELARAFHAPTEKVRVIVPDFGSGYGGKHTGEAAIEAARL
ncbi:MAG TPA: molybdopterin cofactor-binding domain-containing protein, partial [Verrucomicrobiae bacterium]|nr:molybdopterin cofactor-binding domain-containing protein [Verrucomicrobiae bacterium]